MSMTLTENLTEDLPHVHAHVAAEADGKLATAAPAHTLPAERRGNFLQHAILAFLNWTDRTPLPWYKWPLLSVWPLIYLYLRRVLLRLNLVDIPQPTQTPMAARLRRTRVPVPKEAHRDDDGWGNDVNHPDAGANGATIGRNMRYTPPHLIDAMGSPSPQLVAQKLLARRPADGFTGFRPAGMQLNVMAAAWVQAMIHDWQDHELRQEPEAAVHFRHSGAGCPLKRFSLRPTDNVGPPGTLAYVNTRTGWWDASFVYGQHVAQVAQARTFKGGRLKMDTKTGGVPIRTDGIVEMGDQMNSWAGITVLQDLFAREHNAIADAIAAAQPGLSDEELFGKARLCVAALVAKIHTVDWTVELLQGRAMKEAIYSNWYGLFNLGRFAFGFVGRKKASNHGIKFSLTEEFTAVYRLHTMIPDTLVFGDGAQQELVAMDGLFGSDGNKVVRERGAEACLQATLRYPCGANALFNFPAALRALRTTEATGVPEQHVIDMAAVDVYRDRERGIPKYNDFRRRLNMNPKRDWADLTGGDAEAMAALAEVYGEGGIEDCDLLVGNLAEAKPPGFAISETSFMLFLLMAARRVEADRFLTEFWRPDVYTPTGFEWIKRTRGLRDLVRRHFPDTERELAAHLPPEGSAFTPTRAMPAVPEGFGGFGGRVPSE